MQKETRPYGLWRSPLDVNAMSEAYRLYDVQWDTHSAALVWQERRSSGAALVVQHEGENPRDLIRDTRIGGGLLFGGGGYTVGQGWVYFVGEASRIYRIPLTGGTPQPLSPAYGTASAPKLSPDGRWLVYIHSVEERESLVVMPTDGSDYPQPILQGVDFIAQPAWHPAGDMIACITWDHPHMPWNASQLHLLQLDNTATPTPTAHHIIAGADWTESVFGAAFSPDGSSLVYSSDRDGWWRPYLHNLQTGQSYALTNDNAEYGLPMWLQDMRTFEWDAEGTLYVLHNHGGDYTLRRITDSDRAIQAIPGLSAYTHLEQIAVSPVTGEIALIAGATHLPDRIVTLDPETGVSRIRAYSGLNRIAGDYLARADHIYWETPDGVTVHGLYYPPTNPQYQSGGVPPLIVYIHSGPTRQRFAKHFPEPHFFTTRGFAVLEPNYRGSTGYGRDYKNMLHGNWGVVEVEDAASGAAYLVERGLADSSRIIVMGESSGGFSVLQSLILKPGFYRAGVAQAPVTDQFALAMETHKFERHYNDSLLGALPEAAPVYRDRSPVFHAGKIQDAVALFHGSRDTVVPPSQSERVAGALRRSGVPLVYKVYEGEGHSFRGVDTQRDYYATVLNFLMQQVIYR